MTLQSLTRSINCSLGTHFHELLAVQKNMAEFIAEHDDKAPHHIKSRPHGYWDSTRAWEYAMAIAFTQPKPGQTALDIGSAKSVLSWFLANRGVGMTCVDLLEQEYKESIKNNQEYFHFDHMFHMNMNAKDFDVENQFDFVYNISVIEHVMANKRRDIEGKLAPDFWGNNYEPTEEIWEEERGMLRQNAKALKPGGILALSYDFDAGPDKTCDRVGSVLRGKEDIQTRILDVTGLKLHGGKIDIDDIPAARAIGILFLEKP